MSQPIRHLCVYCSSSDDVDPVYVDAARAFGAAMAQRGFSLVFGGGGIGLMGVVARAVHEHAGHVIGVIPRFMEKPEVAYREADELVVTDDMRQRKHVMEQRADAFVILPGGIGTLEELFEILTLRYLEQHRKPIVILNTAGVYDPLVALLDRMTEQRLVRPKVHRVFSVVREPDDVFAAIDALARPA